MSIINKINNKWLLSIIASFVFVFTAHSQGFYAQVSSKKVQVGVPFEYAVVITVNANNYAPANLKEFDIVSGPNQSNSVQYTNGVMTQQMVISYGLVAKKEGKITIGVASVMSGGQKLESEPITIEVVKGGTGNQSNFNQNDDPKFNSKVSGGDVFIRTGISKNKCYVGEQVTITQKIYSRLQMIGFQKFAQPTYDGFYSQAQESVSKGQAVVENLDGVNYYTYELFRSSAIANKSGKISLNSVEGDVIVRRQTNAKPKNVFEQFFGSAGYEDVPVTVKSKPLIIDVLPVPEEGKPTNYFGAVGDFSYKVQVTRNELKANDAFNLKMTISGKGNLKLLDSPKLNLPESFETYDAKISESGNSKTFDYLVIPRNEGEFKLENLDFSYFSLDSKKYITIPSQEIKINVLPADPNSKGAQVFTQQSQVKETENDIRYIKKGDFLLTESETEFFNSSKHILFLILPFFALGVGLFIRRNYIKNNSNLVLVKERKAARLAKKQLVNAEKLMKLNSKDEFYTEILMAINSYLGNKLNIPASDLSHEKIKNVLENKKVDIQCLKKLITTLETSEYAKYAPGAVSGDLQQVYKNTVELITDLEEQLNKKV
ncbi:MAG: BatD family protein [Bacteroidota bacterium]|nr:BatD family protein [Bacteroidota bacterium]MDP3145007.1 BatD family protein [Bacteroidota bacterium]